MPRQQRALDPDGGPVVEFARDLRALRARAGDPKFAAMARRTGRSKTALAEAAGGRRLPRWETLEDFVRACEDNPARWRARWLEARSAVDEQIAERLHTGLTTDSVDGAAATPPGPREALAPDTGGAVAQEPPDAGSAEEAVPEETVRSTRPDPTDPAVPSAPSGGGVDARRDPTTGNGRPMTPQPIAPAVSGRATRRRALVAATILVIIAGGAFTLGRITAGPEPWQIPLLRAVEIQNKVAVGPDRLVEDATPAYLSGLPIAYCARTDRHCEVPGTEMGSGAAVAVHCVTHAQQMWNYDLKDPRAASNPDRAASDLWYRASFPDGRVGYISEVYLTASSRGGLDLPGCGPGPADLAAR